MLFEQLTSNPCLVDSIGYVYEGDHGHAVARIGKELQAHLHETGAERGAGVRVPRPARGQTFPEHDAECFARRHEHMTRTRADLSEVQVPRLWQFSTISEDLTRSL